MLGALGGISTIWVVIGVGCLVAHWGLVGHSGRRLMSVLAFTVASPALLFAMMARASLEHVFSLTLVVSALAVAVTAVVHVIIARLAFKAGPGALVIGSMASMYTNAGNFGIPVALALLNDATWAASILLMQVAVLMPVILVLLDAVRTRDADAKPTLAHYLALPLRNPLTVGIVGGLVVNITGVELPAVVWAPIDLIGGMAVPLMLMAFGVSLRLDPLPGRGEHSAHAWTTVALKVVVHPLVAYVLGLAFGMTGGELYAVVVLAALPAAQNVYVVATRYRESELLARDSVFWSTFLSIGSLLGIAALLGT
ncbi:MAG: AEC family transporter [Propioniciclava sp.]|uniref:AEC family transporter n=1 Tax=Propioniciclava sp. TaxID=2038686 RepID=UPI0039E72661